MSPASPASLSALTAEIAEVTTSLSGRLSPSIVAIGSGGRGTGIVIATNRVLTNAHHLRDNTTSVHFADGRSVQAKMIGLDPTWDIAVLSVDTASVPPVVWTEVAPQLGALVFAVSRAGAKPSITHGFISDVDRSLKSPMNQEIAGAFEHTAPLRQGSSGGPVLNADGCIVGLNVVRESDSFAIALPVTKGLRTRITELSGTEHHES